MLFLYRIVLSQELGLVDSVRAKPSQHVPTVLSRAEVQAVLHEMSGIHLLMARLLYGSGMRLMDLGVEVRALNVVQDDGVTARFLLTDHADIAVEVLDPQSGRTLGRHLVENAAAGPQSL
mgnify:CR=1 FL=1